METIDTSTPPFPGSSSAPALVGDIEAFLREMIAQLAPEPAPHRGPGRPQILPALGLWAGLLVCILHGFSGKLTRWRLLASGNLWSYPRFPLSDQAVYKRLANEGTAPLERLFHQVRTVLAARLTSVPTPALAPFATEVMALDETTLDPVARTLPPLREVPDGDARLLPGKLAVLFDIRRQQWRAVQCAGVDPFAVFVAQGRALRFIRPSSRTVIRAPTIPLADLVPMPPDLILVRPSRYAQRNRGKRPSKKPTREAI